MKVVVPLVKNVLAEITAGITTAASVIYAGIQK